MPLYLLRHGETVLNVAGRFQGHDDSPLTDRGIQQARANAQRLSKLVGRPEQARFVSSPLGRALQTSEYICRTLGLEISGVYTDQRLMEMNYGAWQGMTEFEIEQEYPGLRAQRNSDPDTFKIPGNGESYNALYKRVDGWLLDTRSAWEHDQSWIVVSHGGTGSVIRGRYLNLPTQKIRSLDRSHNCFYEFKNGNITTHSTNDGGP